jgi:cytochrome c5
MGQAGLSHASQAGREAMTSHRSSKAARCAATLATITSILSGCALTLQNMQPAQELARESQPPGSVYVGWRVYNERCAGCHGADATGPAKVPDLLDRVREMGSRRFVNLVLRRYDWSVSAGEDEAARIALVEDILQRKEGAFAMPAWQDEPPVSAHILDVYAYLAARAEGTQGTGRPAR